MKHLNRLFFGLISLGLFTLCAAAPLSLIWLVITFAGETAGIITGIVMVITTVAYCVGKDIDETKHH